jgi:hypothetical protein
MDGRNTRAFEQILMMALQCNSEIIGFTALEPGRGPGICAKGVAEVAAYSGRATLLLSLADDARNGNIRWSSWSVRNNDNVRSVSHQEEGWPFRMDRDRLGGSFLDKPAMAREKLASCFPQYDFLIIELPMLLDASVETINPVAAACACDQTFLICQRGRSRKEHLLRAMEIMRSSSCELAGIVNDESCYDTPGQEIATWARHFTLLGPRFAKWVERYALTSALLN